MATVTEQPAQAGTTPVAASASAFRANTQRTIKRPGTVQTNTVLTGSQVALNDIQLPPTTLLRCIYIEVTALTSANAATVVFGPDAPLNVFGTVNFHDAQGTSIVGAFDSFTLAMAQKWFGFVNNSDVTTSAIYSATPGAGATGGSFTEVFRIPVEAVGRTGVGSQINTDTQSPLVLSLALNQGTAIYATPPTTLPAVSVVVSFGGYWNQSGNPNTFATPTAIGTLNYVNWTNYTGLAGQQQFQLGNIGLGNDVENIMFINRLTAGLTRVGADAAFANPLQVAYRGNVLGQWSELLWKHIMSEAYDANNPTLDDAIGANATPVVKGAMGLNQGVYNLWFNEDFTFDPGNTLFYDSLETAVGDSIELTGNWITSSTLYEIINFLAVSGPVSAIQGH
jgi:hypothetical protein